MEELWTQIFSPKASKEFKKYNLGKKLFYFPLLIALSLL